MLAYRDTQAYQGPGCVMESEVKFSTSLSSVGQVQLTSEVGFRMVMTGS